MVIGSFASMTMLVKNSFIDQLRSLYVLDGTGQGIKRTARSLWSRIPQRDAHRDRRIPSAIVGIFFGSAFLIETIFSLEPAWGSSATSGAQARFPDHVRHLVLLYAARAWS